MNIQTATEDEIQLIHSTKQTSDDVAEAIERMQTVIDNQKE